MLIAVELGGSSRQTCVFLHDEAALLVDGGSVVSPGARYGLAAPGVIRDGRLYYAANLDIPDRTTLRDAGGLPAAPEVGVNDAIAQAAGEWYLRRSGNPPRDLFYVGIGTGVGSARVVDGARVEPTNLGHTPGWSQTTCPGYGKVGCLDTVISGRVLPTPLSEQDQQFVARTLAQALERHGVGDESCVVLAGGLVKRNPEMLTRLNEIRGSRVEPTAAPAAFKSSAPYGLLAIWRGALTAP